MNRSNQQNLQELINQIVAFRDARDWKQFHNPKDMSISLVLEASEVLEHFQWKSPKQVEDHIANKKDEIGEELIDTLYWILLISHDLNINIPDSFNKKMAQNEKKYPIAKSKGNAIKYTELSKI